MKSWTLLACLALPLAAHAAPDHRVQVAQGGVARWAGMEAKACGFLGKRYPAVDGDCYYPVDFQLKPGVHEIALYDTDGRQHLGWMTVEKVDFPEVEITLPDDTYINLSEDNAKRHREERARVVKALKVDADEPQFSLPLAKPVKQLPQSENDFASRRLFNGTHKSTHTGRDAPVSVGSKLGSVADGTVILAEDQFFTGNAVYVDHGGGLVSMFFHLSELSVATGDTVKRGQAIGKVGSSGRSTGPHMHLGIRWMNARIDPYLLLEAPAKLPSVADSAAEEQAKIDQAQRSEPPEGDQQ